jgi:hypothetical protein
MIRNRFPRRYAEFTDQHGRLFGAEVEGETGHPCGPVKCLHRTPAGNLPPWLPESKYLVFDSVKQGVVTIDYPQAIADRQASVDRWEAEKNRLALLIAPSRVIEEVEAPSAALLSIIGARPPGPEIVEAASQGNKWALGLTDAMPKWAEPFMAIQGPVKAKPAVRLYPDADEDQPTPVKKSHHKQPSRTPQRVTTGTGGPNTDEDAA